MCCFFERTATDKDLSMQQFLNLFSPTFKYTEAPKLVSMSARRSLEAARELSSKARYDLCLLEMQDSNDYKGSTVTTAGR